MMQHFFNVVNNFVLKEFCMENILTHDLNIKEIQNMGEGRVRWHLDAVSYFHQVYDLSEFYLL